MDNLNERFKRFNDLSEESKNDYQMIMNQSPLSRTKHLISNQMLKQDQYRIKILQNVPTFKGTIFIITINNIVNLYLQ
jgi:hypothetical protein